MTATLHFDGTNRFITTPALSAMNGSITLAMLVKKEVSSNAPLFAFGSESTMPTFYINSSLNLAMYYNVDIVPGVGITLNEWYLIVFTYTPTSGAWQFRIHVKNISTNGAWSHSNWGGPTNIPPSALGKLLRIGTAPGITGPFQGDFGLLAWWDGVILTDVQVESLAANKKTSDWAALSPSMLAEMTAVTPIDLKASAAWTPSGLPLLTGSDPAGWTFDGLGPVSTPNIQMFTKAGWTIVNNRIKTDYTVTPGYTKDRAFDPETATVQEVARVLGSLVDDLKTAGLIKP
jgi:hypothetical protein